MSGVRKKKVFMENITHTTSLSDVGINVPQSVLFVFENQYVKPRNDVECRLAAQKASESFPIILKNQAAMDREEKKKAQERAEKKAINDKFKGGGRTIGGVTVMAPSKRHKPAAVAMHGDGKRLSDGKVMIEGGRANGAKGVTLSEGKFDYRGNEVLLMEMNKRNGDPMRNIQDDHFEKAMMRLFCDPSTTDDAKSALKDRENQEWERVITHCWIDGSYTITEGVSEGHVLGGKGNRNVRFCTVELQPKVTEIFTTKKLKFDVQIYMQRDSLAQFTENTFNENELSQISHHRRKYQLSAAFQNELLWDILWTFVYHANSDGVKKGTLRDFYKAVCPRVDWDFIEVPEDVRKRKPSEKAIQNERQSAAWKNDDDE
jgi:hypothetical protein